MASDLFKLCCKNEICSIGSNRHPPPYYTALPHLKNRWVNERKAKLQCVSNTSYVFLPLTHRHVFTATRKYKENHVVLDPKHNVEWREPTGKYLWNIYQIITNKEQDLMLRAIYILTMVNQEKRLIFVLLKEALICWRKILQHNTPYADRIKRWGGDRD